MQRAVILEYIVIGCCLTTQGISYRFPGSKAGPAVFHIAAPFRRLRAGA
jgi:hypothetical protein